MRGAFSSLAWAIQGSHSGGRIYTHRQGRNYPKDTWGFQRCWLPSPRPSTPVPTFPSNGLCLARAGQSAFLSHLQPVKEQILAQGKLFILQLFLIVAPLV